MSKEMNQEDIWSQEDKALVKAFQAEESAAFDKLVLRHKDKVFNLCYRLLGDYEEANDCAQETFVKVFCSLKNFRFESTFSTWLYRITVNICKNKLKSLAYRYRKKMVWLDKPKETEDSNPLIQIGDGSPSPLIELERKERAMLIQKAIDSLPEEQKIIVVLRDIKGLSYEEVAKITGYNLGTVKSKLARARQQLRKKLRGLI